MPDPNEGSLIELTSKFQDLVKEVVELKLTVSSSDGNINKNIGGLQEQVRRQAEILEKQQRYLEMLYRRDREKNIIVTGVPDENEALEGATTEEGKLVKIWSCVEAGDEVKGHRRLGMKVDNRRRPILVIVHSKKARDRILEKQTN